MKQIYIQTENPKNIKDVNQANNFSMFYRESISNSNLITPQPEGTEERLLRQGRGLNIFLTQNKGKGPPGRQRSPGYYADHPPDGRTGSPDGEADQDASPFSFGREGSARLPARQGVSQNRFQFIHTEQIFFTIHKNSNFIYY